MWFKQSQIFQLSSSIVSDPSVLESKLEAFTFKPCLPTLSFSYGWMPPTEQADASLVYSTQNHRMICMRLEEKVLPATVIRQELNEKIKKLQETQDRSVSQKEKYALKDDITNTLLPRAFSKYDSIYAYFDIKNNWLILNTTTESKIEKFLALFKKTFPDMHYHYIHTQKMAPILTRWLKHNETPAPFEIEKAGVLKDPRQEGRIIRCQQQELTAPGIQSLLKDGCEVHQISLSWSDKMSFMLVSDLTLKNIRYGDEVLELAKDQNAESELQRFDADFVIMTELLSALWKQLIHLFGDKSKQQIDDARTVTV